MPVVGGNAHLYFSMKHEYYTKDEYTNIGKALIEDDERLQALGFDIFFLCSDNEKKSKHKVIFAECVKVQEMYRFFIPHDFIIVIYEPNIAGMTDEQKRILIEHELLHVGADDNGEPQIVPHDVEEFRKIIEKYGIDWAVT